MRRRRQRGRPPEAAWLGGTDDPWNLRAICKSCHKRRKLGMSDEEITRESGGHPPSRYTFGRRGRELNAIPQPVRRAAFTAAMDALRVTLRARGFYPDSIAELAWVNEELARIEAGFEAELAAAEPIQ